MNEQIKKLCEQSKVYANESTKDFTGNEPVVWIDYYTEKFAELIVKECAQFVEDKFDFIGDEIVVKEKMLEYFGVEE